MSVVIIPPCYLMSLFLIWNPHTLLLMDNHLSFLVPPLSYMDSRIIFPQWRMKWTFPSVATFVMLSHLSTSLRDLICRGLGRGVTETGISHTRTSSAHFALAGGLKVNE